MNKNNIYIANHFKNHENIHFAYVLVKIKVLSFNLVLVSESLGGSFGISIFEPSMCQYTLYQSTTVHLIC